MSDMSTHIQVWFLRHGKTPFNYENPNYNDFIEMMCNGRNTQLAEDPEINFAALPKRVDLVCHSRYRRSFQTAEVLRKKLNIKLIEEQQLLDEVSFDRNIIRSEEYTSLVNSRKDIIERWYSGENSAETFEDSLARVRAIETFIRGRNEKTIILITHGWFLRLLEIYFFQGKHTNISLADLLEVQLVELGHCFKATVARECGAEAQMDLVENQISSIPLVAQVGSLVTETPGRKARYLTPVIS